MTRNRSAVWLLAFAAGLASCTGASDLTWEKKYSKASSKAKKEGKILVVDFTAEW